MNGEEEEEDVIVQKTGSNEILNWKVTSILRNCDLIFSVTGFLPEPRNAETPLKKFVVLETV